MTYTGAPQSLLRMAEVLLQNDYEVEVATLQAGPLEKEYIEKGIPVTRIEFSKKIKSNIQKLKQFDLVIANTIFCAEFANEIKEYVPTVLFIREASNIPWILEKNNIKAEWLIQASNIVCISEYAKECIESTYGISEISVIPNFIEDYNNKTVEILDNTIDFIVSGTVEERKGQDIARKAFFHLPKKLQEKAKLHIVGAMPSWAEEYHKQLRLGIEEQIVYHGEIKDREKLYELYKQMDVFLVPSTDEACSLVALEAAMLGKPLVVTENTGAKYIVTSECIVPTKDVKTLCNVIQDCIEHIEQWKEKGKENRERYMQYATKIVYEKTLLSYIEAKMEAKNKVTENKKKVSIIVPVYNVEQYLEQCMNSLIGQTLKEIEIICVNDGSTDNGLAILEQYAKKDARIKVISGKNYGYGHAMNTGMDVAQGEYIGIVEPDDYVDLHMFEVLYQRAKAMNADIIKADFYRFYGEGASQKNIYHSTAKTSNNYNRLICPKKEKECFRFIMNTWSGIYRRSFLEQYHIRHNETPGASYQDNGFWFQGFCQAERITFLDKPLYYNRRDNPNSSVNNREKIYCANEEYAYIRKFLKENKALEQEFLYQFSMKKYHTYLFTLNRIGWQYKKEYLQRFAKEFRYAKEQNELSKAVFTPQEWSNLHWIMNQPEDYYEKVIKNEVEISVIIPVYNTEKYIKQCLESLEAQQFKRFEVICIDDGSTDNSKVIIESFVCRDKRFCLYSQQNKGAGTARNKGIELAMGEYLMFLDADDYFAPELLLHAWQKIRETESDICVVNSWQHDEETGTITPCHYALRMNEYPTYRPFRVEQMQKNPFRNFMGWAWDKLYLKRFIVNNDLKFQEQRTSNDMFFTYMSLFKADRITTLDERLIYQRRNNKNSLSMTREKSWDCFYHALIAMKQELMDMGLYDRYRIYFVNYALHSCLWNMNTLSEETANLLRVRIKKEWANSLEISDLKEQEAEYPKEYQDYQYILKEGRKGLEDSRKEYQIEQENAKKRAKKEKVVRVPVENMYGSEAIDYQNYVNEIRNSKLFKIALAMLKLFIKARVKIRQSKLYKILASMLTMSRNLIEQWRIKK